MAQIPRNLPLRPLQAAIFCPAAGPPDVKPVHCHFSLYNFRWLRQEYQPLFLPPHAVILSPRLPQAEWAMEAGCLQGEGQRFTLLQ